MQNYCAIVVRKHEDLSISILSESALLPLPLASLEIHPRSSIDLLPHSSALQACFPVDLLRPKRVDVVESLTADPSDGQSPHGEEPTLEVARRASGLKTMSAWLHSRQDDRQDRLLITVGEATFWPCR